MRNISYAAFTLRETNTLTDLKARLEELLGARRVAVVLYGSRARGDHDQHSDLDVAIMVDGLTKQLKAQILNIITTLELEYLTPLSTLILSREEFEHLKRRERRIARDIEEEGRIL